MSLLFVAYVRFRETARCCKYSIVAGRYLFILYVVSILCLGYVNIV